MDYHGRSPSGRTDFMTNIDNETIDFAQLEALIHGTHTVAASTSTPSGHNSNNIITTTANQVGIKSSVISATTASSSGSATQISNDNSVTQSHLPESPPDSGSEPPYSPADLHSLNAQQQLQNGNNIQTLSEIDINNVTELHVAHHLLNNPNTIYITEVANGGGTQQNNDHQNDQQIVLQSQTSSILDIDHHRTYRNDLLTLGQQQQQHSSDNVVGSQGQNLHTEELTRIIPDLYGHHQLPAPPPPPPPPPQQQIHDQVHHHQHHTHIQFINNNSRKRKLSQQSNGSDVLACQQNNQQSIIKPEPIRDLCDIQYIQNHGDMLFCQTETSQNQCSLSPICGSGSSLESSSPCLANDAQQQNGNHDGGEHCPLQCIRFTPFQQQNWHILCDQSLQEIPIPHYRVDADKGFNFSNSDDAFVCQKKNHFQITCHAQLQGAAVFIRTASGLEKVRSFHLHFYGVKLEAPTQTIRVEQSQSDRSKKPFHPVPIDLQNGQVSKVTVGRLHFSETTSNNMRKKGRPNPEQRYFQLVVGLHAHTHSGHFPIISHGSERIIVRASNPGQFESDVELSWQRGATQESIYHAGRVGINTDRPDESLVVHGNLKVSGHIVHPSDSRAKQEINELDTSQQLINVQKIRVVRYRYEPEFAAHSGLSSDLDNHIIDTGVIAQEVQKILPDAVQETGSLILPNGQIIDNFLVVNKERIFMENIGAVKELCKVTGSLETRIEQLERINSRLTRIQKFDKKTSRKYCYGRKCKQYHHHNNPEDDDYDLYDDNEEDVNELCSNKMIQIIIIILVVIMAICLAAISTLYFVEHHKQNYDTNRNEFMVNFGDIPKTNHYSPMQQDQSTVYTKTVYNSSHYNANIINAQPRTNYVDNYNINPIESTHSTNLAGYQGTTVVALPSISSAAVSMPKKIKNHPNLSYQTDTSNYENDTKNQIITKPSKPRTSATSHFLQTEIDTNSIDVTNLQYSNLIVNKNKSGTLKYLTQSVNNKIPLLSSSSSSSASSTASSTIGTRAKTTISTTTSTTTTTILPNSDDSKPDTNDLPNIITNSDIIDTIPANEPEETENGPKIIRVPVIGQPNQCSTENHENPNCHSVCCKDNKNLAEIPDDLEFQGGGGGATSGINTNTSNITTFTNENNNPNDEISSSSVEQQHQYYYTQHNPNVTSIVTPESSQIIRQQAESFKSQDLGCYNIQLKIRSDTFNQTFKRETICRHEEQSLNVTYELPFSKYMQEIGQIELHFMSPELSDWYACPRKYKHFIDETNDSHDNINRTITNNPISNSNSFNNIDLDTQVYQKNSTKYIFYIVIPVSGDFEKLIQFRSSLMPASKNVCQLNRIGQFVQYNIKLFRNCN